jgi:hypothetical protein
MRRTAFPFKYRLQSDWRPGGAAFFLSGLISAVPPVNLRPMKTGIILINRCIITS